MIFDEKTIRFFAKKYNNDKITIYPYYQIKTKGFKKITNSNISIIALIIKYPNNGTEEYYLQFFKKKDMKYMKEIIEKFKTLISR